MGRRFELLVATALFIGACQDKNAEIIGNVHDIDTGEAIEDVDVGFGQTVAGKFSIREEFTATTGAMGGYLMATEFGPFPEGFVTFSHVDYEPDTVDFYGASVGERERVDVNLVFIDTVVVVLSSELFGIVVDAADSTFLDGVDVELTQLVADTLQVIVPYRTSTSLQGGYTMQFDNEDIPAGFLLFSHENYEPDTVSFAGVIRGNSVQVNASLSRIDTSAGGAPGLPDSYNH